MAKNGKPKYGVVPYLSVEQRREALDKGLQVRRARADLLTGLKAGKISLAKVLHAADDPIVGRTRVAAILCAMPGCGPITAARLMDELGIASTRRVKGLGPRQREGILEFFDSRSPRHLTL